MLACVQIDSCSLIEFGKCCEEEGKNISSFCFYGGFICIDLILVAGLIPLQPAGFLAWK